MPHFESDMNRSLHEAPYTLIIFDSRHSPSNQTPLFKQLLVTNGNKTTCNVTLMHVNLRKPEAKFQQRR